MSKKDAFLCHAHEDKPMVKSVLLGLGRYEISSWLDEAEMLPGDRLVEKISEAIDMADWFLVFLTANSVKKPWVKFELSQAMDREIRADRPFVLPVLLYDCDLPAFLRSKMYVDLRDWDEYGGVLRTLVVRIKGDIDLIPKDFIMSDLEDENVAEDFLLSLPREQAAIEMKLRYDNKWTSRRLTTLQQYSGLTLKQVIHYCEVSAHILINPMFNACGEVFYGLRWRVMSKFKNDREYAMNLQRYLSSLERFSTHSYPADVLSYLMSFHKHLGKP